MKHWLRKIIFSIDFIVIIFTLLFFLYGLISFLFYTMMGYNVDRELFLFDMRSANIYGILFVYTLCKLFIGFIYGIIIKDKESPPQAAGY
jgi:hypothetical protein